MTTPDDAPDKTPDGTPDGGGTGGDRIGRATVVMATGTVLSRFTGFLRAAVIAATLGLALTADMFSVADAIPAMMYTIVAGGVINAVLVPQLVRAMRRDADGGEAYAQRLSSAVLLVLALATSALVLAAPWVIRLFVGAELTRPELAAQLDTIVLLARFTLVQVFFYGLYTLLGQMLNARGRFGPMMFAPVLNNVVTIVVFGSFLLLQGPLDATAGEYTRAEATWFGLGTTLGVALQALVLLPVLRRTGLRLRLRRDLRGVGLGTAFRLATWTVLLIGIMQLTQVVVIRLATAATAGADGAQAAGLAVYNNAFLITMVPHSVITVSLATALLPDLSRLSAAGDVAGVRGRMTTALRAVLAVMLPIAGLLLAVAGPVTTLVFGYGAAAPDVDLVALTLAAFLPGLLGFTLTFLVQRAFYAAEDTRTPVLVQVVVSAVQITLSVLLVPTVDPAQVSTVLAACWSVASLTGSVLSLLLLQRRLGSLRLAHLLGYVLLVAVAAVPATVAAWWLVSVTEPSWAAAPLAALGVAAAAGLVAVGLYLAAAWLLRVGPVRDSGRWARRRLRSR